MHDPKQSTNSPRDQFSTKELDTTFQRILELTEQICRRFEAKWPPPSPSTRKVKKTAAKWAAPLPRR